MSSRKLDEWERAEVQRSAAEAAHTQMIHLLADSTQVGRYLNPPANTAYPLEYSYHLLGDVRGRTVLDYGCGDGRNSLVLARRGAKVIALDISPDLIRVARQRLIVNNSMPNVELIVGSAHALPLPDDSVDIVFGMAILHHLDLALSANEVKRVLRRGGRAIFKEPVRNSKLIQILRGLVPHKAPDVSPFERPLTGQELATYADGFTEYRSKAFLLPTTGLVSILPPLRKRFIDACHRIDAAVLRQLPSLGYYAAVQVIEVVK